MEILWNYGGFAKFISICRTIVKYTDIEELTVPMINEYIEKVVVHEATGGRKGKDRKQQVDVYFNFIGNCQVPQKVDIEKMA